MRRNGIEWVDGWMYYNVWILLYNCVWLGSSNIILFWTYISSYKYHISKKIKLQLFQVLQKVNTCKEMELFVMSRLLFVNLQQKHHT